MLFILLVYLSISFTNALHCPILEFSIPIQTEVSNFILTETDHNVWENQQLLLRLSQTGQIWKIQDPSGLIFESEPGEFPWLAKSWFSVLEDRNIEIEVKCLSEDGNINDIRRMLQTQASIDPSISPSFNMEYCVGLYLFSGTQLDGYYSLQSTAIHNQRWWQHSIFSEYTLTYFDGHQRWTFVSTNGTNGIMIESEITTEPFPPLNANWRYYGTSNDGTYPTEIQCAGPLPTAAPSKFPSSCVDHDSEIYGITGQYRSCREFVDYIFSIETLDCGFKYDGEQTIYDLCCPSCTSQAPTASPNVGTCYDDDQAARAVTNQVFDSCESYVDMIYKASLDCDYMTTRGPVRTLCCASCTQVDPLPTALPSVSPSSVSPTLSPNPYECVDNDDYAIERSQGFWPTCEIFVQELLFSSGSRGWGCSLADVRSQCCQACKTYDHVDPTVTTMAPSVSPVLPSDSCKYIHVVNEGYFDLWYQKDEARIQYDKAVWVSNSSHTISSLANHIWLIGLEDGSLISRGSHAGDTPPSIFEWIYQRDGRFFEIVSLNILCHSVITDCNSLCEKEPYSPGCTKGSDPTEVNLCLAQCYGTEVTAGECPAFVGYLDIDFQVDGGSLSSKSADSLVSKAFHKPTAIVSPVANGIDVQIQEVVKLRDPPADIRMIIVTPIIYEGRPILRITYQLKTAAGSTAVDASNAEVSLSIEFGELFQDVLCPVDIQEDSGVPNTMCDITLDSYWFQSTNIVPEVRLSLRSHELVRSEVSIDTGLVQIHAKQSYTKPSESAIWGVLTSHPVFQHESVTLRLYANVVFHSLNLWMVGLSYDDEVLALESIAPGDQFYEPTMTTESTNEIEFYSSVRNSASRESTMGELLLATLTFSVIGDSGTRRAINYLMAKSMTDWDAFDFLTNELSNLVDYTGIGTTANIVLNDDARMGTYAIIEEPDVFNTPVLSAERDIVISIPVMGVYYDRYQILTVADCEASNNIFEVSSMNFCILALNQNSYYHGSTEVSIHGVPYTMRAWYPGSRSLETDNLILRSIGCNEFESSKITLWATWHSGPNDIGPVIVNEYVEFRPMRPDIVDIRDSYAIGVSLGSAAVYIRVEEILTFTVVSEVAGIVGLHATVLSGIHLSPEYASVSSSDHEAAISADVQYLHEFLFEGDYGKIFAYLELSGGVFVDVTMSENLSVDIDPDYLLSDSVYMYGISVYVPINAESSISRNFDVVWGCNGQNLATSSPMVNISMTPIRALQLTSDVTELTANTIAMDQFGIRSIAELSLMVEYEGGVERNILYDSRVSIETASNAVSISSNGVVSVVNPMFAGSIDITASFRGFSSSITFEIVVFNVLSTKFHQYPYIEGSIPNANYLELIQCSSHYQQAAVSVIAMISNGETADVSEFCTLRSDNELVVGIQRGILTANKAGESGIFAECWDEISMPTLVEVVDENQWIVSMFDRWPTINRWFYVTGEVDLIATLQLDVTFADLTLYENVFGMSGLQLGDQFDYSVSTDDLSISNGEYQIRKNSWQAIDVTISTNCGPQISTSSAIVTNLLPKPWDIDIQMPNAYPRQFSELLTGDTFEIDISLNAALGILNSFLFKIYFPSNVFRVEHCNVREGWSNKDIEFNIDGVPGEIAVGGFGGDSSTSLATLLLATCTLAVATEDSALAEFSGVIEELKVEVDGESQLMYDNYIVAGRGFVRVNGGGLEHIQTSEPQLLSRRRMEFCHDAECCDELLYGDVNQDCMVTPYDVEVASYYTSNVRKPSLPAISELTDFQRQQMDPNQDWRFDATCLSNLYDPPCPNGGSDLLFLLRFILQKFVWIGMPTVAQNGEQLILQVDVWKHLNQQPTKDEVTVWFEIKTDLNLDVLSPGNDAIGSYVKIPAMLDEESGKFQAIISGAFVSETVTLTVLTETKNYSGESSLDRRFAFRSAFFYTGVHTPFLTFDIEDPSPLPSSTPVISPSLSPTMACLQIEFTCGTDFDGVYKQYQNEGVTTWVHEAGSVLLQHPRLELTWVLDNANLDYYMVGEGNENAPFANGSWQIMIATSMPVVEGDIITCEDSIVCHDTHSPTTSPSTSRPTTAPSDIPTIKPIPLPSLSPSSVPSPNPSFSIPTSSPVEAPSLAPTKSCLQIEFRCGTEFDGTYVQSRIGHGAGVIVRWVHDNGSALYQHPRLDFSWIFDNQDFDYYIQGQGNANAPHTNASWQIMDASTLPVKESGVILCENSIRCHYTSSPTTSPSTSRPTTIPSDMPSALPSLSLPSSVPSPSPTISPSFDSPTSTPSNSPSIKPSPNFPSSPPSNNFPTLSPSQLPTNLPSMYINPSKLPSELILNDFLLQLHLVDGEESYLGHEDFTSLLVQELQVYETSLESFYSLDNIIATFEIRTFSHSHELSVALAEAQETWKRVSATAELDIVRWCTRNCFTFPSISPTSIPTPTSPSNHPSASPNSLPSSTPSSYPPSYFPSKQPNFSIPSHSPHSSPPSTTLPSRIPSEKPLPADTANFIMIYTVSGVLDEDIHNNEPFIIDTMQDALSAEVSINSVHSPTPLFRVQIIFRVVCPEDLYESKKEAIMSWSTWIAVENELSGTFDSIQSISACVNSDCVHAPSTSPSISFPTLAPSLAPSKISVLDLSFRMKGLESSSVMETHQQGFINNVNLALGQNEPWDGKMRFTMVAINRRRLQDDIAVSMQVFVEEEYFDRLTAKAALDSTWTMVQGLMRTMFAEEFSDFFISRWCVDGRCVSASTTTGNPQDTFTQNTDSDSSTNLLAIVLPIIAIVTCCIVVFIGWRMLKSDEEKTIMKTKTGDHYTFNGGEQWSETDPETDTGEVSEIENEVDTYDMEIEQALQNIPHLCEMKNKIISLIVQLSRMESNGRAELIPQWVKQIEFQQKELHAALVEMFGEDRMAEYSDRYDDLWDTARLIATQTNIPKRGVGSSCGLFFEIFDYRCNDNINRDEFAAAARIISRGIPENDIDVIFNLIDCNQLGAFTEEDIQIFMYSGWSGKVETFRRELNAFIESHDIEETLDLLKIQYAAIPERTVKTHARKRFPGRKDDSDMEYFGSTGYVPDKFREAGYASTVTTDDEETSAGHDTSFSSQSRMRVGNTLGKRRRNFEHSDDSTARLNDSFEEVFNDHDQSYETFDIPYRSNSEQSSYPRMHRSASREPFVNIDTLEPKRTRHEFVAIDRIALPSQKKLSHVKQKRRKRNQRKFSLDTRVPSRPSLADQYRRMSFDFVDPNSNMYKDMAGEMEWDPSPANVGRKQDPLARPSRIQKTKEDPTFSGGSIDSDFDWDGITE